MKPTCSILFLFLIGVVHAGDSRDFEVQHYVQTSCEYGDYRQSQLGGLRFRYGDCLQAQPDKNRVAHLVPIIPNPARRIDRPLSPLPPSTDFGAKAAQATRLVTLDQELQTSMGRFDEMILQEQARVKAVVPASRESADFSGDGDASTRLGPERRNGSSDAPVDKTDDAPKTRGQERRNGPPGGAPPPGNGPNNGQGKGDSRRNSGEPTDREEKPKDREDADSNDDIVARQLREAAEQETDPALRERLWEEYRHYKQGL